MEWGENFSEKQQFYLAFSKSLYYHKKVWDTNKNTASEKSWPEVELIMLDCYKCPY